VIVISATFVAEPLATPLGFMLAELGIEPELGFAPYHQVFQQLLTPGSDFDRNRNGISIALIRLEDFVRDQADPAEACQTVVRIAEELGAALESFAAALKGTLLLVVLSPSARVPAAVAVAIETASTNLLTRVAIHASIQVLVSDDIDRVASADRFDVRRDELAHIPFSDAYFAAMALALSRRIHALRVTAAKVLVLDCDNTLWRGVVGEDGLEGIALTQPFLALQDFAVAQQRKGILVCLASKNSEADVIEVLDKRSDMKLRASDVVAHRINWLPKTVNLRSLAEELNLGLDAFVFLDDNPVECGQMRAELPQVVTLQVPPEAEISDWLKHIWNFDKLATTAEDSQRTQMYRENAARRTLESSVGDIGEFLAALNLQVDIQTPVEDEWPRIEQLTQRTNQFNFTTRRRNVQELKALVTQGAQVLRVRVSDRFGNYGLVGVLIAQAHEQAWEVDTFLLSCRVLGRGVEHAMLRSVAEGAVARGLEAVNLHLISSARNEPARAFIDSVAAAHCETRSDGYFYRIPVAQALEIHHRPGHDPAAVLEARLAEERKGGEKSTSTSTSAARSDRYTRLASVLVSGDAVLLELDRQGRRVRSLSTTATPAASAVEVALKELWEELLGIDELGVEDDYFALGGTSLQSVKLFSEIERRFGVQLRLTTILAAPTVRALTRLIEPGTTTVSNGLVPLRPGRQENLFLVHDGLGETLLYLNLAQRLPGDLSVYGIEPRRLPGIALAHASMEDMAAYYVEQIQSVQPHGPYRLGGMCAGGVIAYAMASHLKSRGEGVEVVIIMDGATPQAARQTGRIANRRLSRMRALIQGERGQGASLTAVPALIAALLGKVWNTLRYEFSALLTRKSAQLRFALLQRLVRQDRPWPHWLPELKVAQIYSAIEARYQPTRLSDVAVLLVRASQGEDADTPYKDIYRDDDFGWRQVAGKLELVDVSGGHASMLQQAYVDSMVSSLLARLPKWSGFSSGSKT
jgi:FkbH-like protein